MKLKIKMGIDLLMTALLLCLMAYQVTGQKLHEWFWNRDACTIFAT